MRVTAMSTTSPPIKNTVSVRINHGGVENNNLLSGRLGNILKGFEKDDFILLGIIAVLIWEGCDDYILLAALGYLFFMGIK